MTMKPQELTIDSEVFEELRDELALQTELIPVGIWRRNYTDEYKEQKIQEYLSGYDLDNMTEKERVDAKAMARNAALKDLYIPAGEALLDDLGVTGDNRGYISMITPTITCTLTPAQILQAAERDDVTRISLSGVPSYVDFETVFVVTEKTEDSLSAPAHGAEALGRAVCRAER